MDDNERLNELRSQVVAKAVAWFGARMTDAEPSIQLAKAVEAYVVERDKDNVEPVVRRASLERDGGK